MPENITTEDAEPRISVLVSTYNAEKYLRACLTDLEEQTIAEQLEIIVIDSGSQQNERAIVEDFQKRYLNIVYLRTEREKLYEAWNRGIKMARGKYITNANSDDSHRKDALEVLAAALDANPEAELAYGDYYNSSAPNDLFSDPHISRRIVHPPYHPATLMFYCVTGCHPMWRRSIFAKIGLFDTQYTAPGDYEFLLRAVQAGLRAVRVPEFLSLFYQNPKGLSFQSEERSKREWNHIQAKYWQEMPIERLFAVNPNHAESAALGWVALGNLAMNIRHPWFDNYSQHAEVAILCYERALAKSPRQAAALHNLAVALAANEKLDRIEPLLRLMTAPQRDELCRGLKSGNMKLIPVQVRPAVEPLDYYPSGKPNKTESVATAAAPMPASSLRAPVRWVGPFLTPGAFSRDGIEGALALAPRVATFATRDHSQPYSEARSFELPPSVKQMLSMTGAKFNFLARGITITAGSPNAFFVPADGVYNIARTTIEADALPARWVSVCNQMREIWVPSEFAREVFGRGGVEGSKLRVVPSGVDSTEFSPGVAPTHLPRRAAWNFLFCDEWRERSGWDVLLTAYFQEFSDRDDVCLYIASHLPGETGVESAEKIRRQVEAKAEELKASARVEVLGVSEFDLPGILAACDCVALPGRAEGWGRNQLQALLMEKALITTGWGAHMDFCQKGNCRLIDFELVEIGATETDSLPLRGFKWAEPSLENLRAALRETHSQPEAARARGRGHRTALSRYDRTNVGAGMVARLLDIERSMNVAVCEPAEARAISIGAENGKQLGRDLQVAWEGSYLDFGSLSHVNRELTTVLAGEKQIDLTRVGPQNPNVPTELKNVARRVQAEAPQVDVTVRHAWPPNWTRPASGAWVLIQPWEFGVLPLDWSKGLGQVDEVWAPSEYVRRVYVDSGVQPSKVKIVPNGIDPAKFRPDVEPLTLATQKLFKFLFVGGTIHRKGPDVLLKSYLEAFTAADDVCLVIKDFGGQSVYQGQTLEKEIAAARQNPNAPEILYLTDELPADAMPRLYAACQCLAHPYRGEGFGLPVLEAMACGLAVIVTGGGATDDFAGDAHAYRLPALRTPIGNAVGKMKLARNGWWLEPAPEALTERLRWVAAHPEEAQAKGRAASDYVRREWTWERAGRVASQRLQDLISRRRDEAKFTAERRTRKAGPITLPTAARMGALSGARELLSKKNLLAAWKATTAAIAVRPYHPEAYLLLAEIASASGNGVVAERLAKHAKALAPEWSAPKRFLKSNKAELKNGQAANELAETIKSFSFDTTRKPRLTVCMIVKNEEKFLGQCLQSIRDAATQIVVVDTGSTDKTVDIAKAYGAEVHHIAWNNDFSAARNAALEHATGDWVLSLDADEELLPEHKETLLREVQNAEAMAYRMPMIDKGREQEGCSYVPRLFRNAPGLFFLGRVHEQVFSSVQARCQQWGLKNLVGKAALVHHGYITSVVTDRNKIERNLRLLELAIEELPNEPNLLMNYGLELVRSGQIQDGLQQYTEALRCASAMPASEVTPELRETLLTQVTSHLMTAKNFQEIVNVWQMPFAKSSNMAASHHFSLGLAYMELKQPGPAAEQMRLCLTKRDLPTFSPRNPEVLKAGPAHCLALCLASLNQLDAAAEFFQVAIAIEPKARAPRFDYARFLAERGRAVEALKWLNELITENTGDIDAWRFGGQIALSKPEFRAFACDWTGEAIKHFRHEPGIILQRAEALFLAERMPQALPLWRDPRLPKHPRSDAARVLCELLVGGCQIEVPKEEEATISQEALKWYRRLIAVGAVGTVHALHEKIEVMRGIMPSFVAVWETATRRAAAATAAAV
jgi:glycosyltransferase involved in cell wall biosynthesis/Tfp pilus assembly protein PilF